MPKTRADADHRAPLDAADANRASFGPGVTFPPSADLIHEDRDERDASLASCACTQGFADLAGTFDYDSDYDFRAVRARGRVRGDDGDDAAEPGLSAAEVVDALQTVMGDPRVPADRRLLVAGLVDAIRDGQLHGGDSDGDHAARR